MQIESLTDLPSVRAYLQRVGAEPRSLKTAVIKELRGQYWKDLATIRFNRNGTVEASNQQFDPTDSERKDIEREFSTVVWPTLKPLSRIIHPPEMIANSEPEHVFEFRDEEELIHMIQVRLEVKGERRYIPWTYWDDGQWRRSEPDGPLPLWGLENIKDATTAFVHEGAKSARKMQNMITRRTAADAKALEEHPWGRELSGAVHLGWIGGALSPYRTDWSALARNGIKRVYIIADNDSAGRSAVPAIAQQLRIPTFMIQFTDEFPRAFDLGDSFPDAMFAMADGVRHYVGPAFRDLLHPATWATDLIANPKGKPTTVLRDSFIGMWAYVEEADVFVCTEMPEILRSEAILNKMLAPFSHAAETSRLIVKSYRGRSARICYRPDHEGLTVTFRGSSAINLHVPGTIRSKAGDPSPWLEFLEYMFINERERKEVERWCATLIAHPELRMGYGLLLVSERQGIGKTTLGAAILAPLVGYNNVGYPGEQDIQSAFNDWMANKRLIVVNEIYSGASWKAYHALKSVITDKDVTVNQKYQRPYTIENWAQVVACSNSLRALKMENDDRRWFYPEITEVPWQQSKFNALRAWIDSGGLSIVKHWAESYGDYIRPAERAPMTDRKADLIEGSRSEAQREAVAVAEALKEIDGPGAILIKDIVAFVRMSVQGRVFDSDYELRKAMVDAGVYHYPKRIKIAGRLHYIVMNDRLKDVIQRSTEDEIPSIIRGAVVKPNDLIKEAM